MKVIFNDNATSASTERAKNALILIGNGFKVSNHKSIPGKITLNIVGKVVLLVFGIKGGDVSTNKKAISLFKRYRSVKEAESEYLSIYPELQRVLTKKQIEELRKAKLERKKLEKQAIPTE